MWHLRSWIYNLCTQSNTNEVFIPTFPLRREQQENLHPLSFPPPSHVPYFLKVSVWEINDHSAAEDDSLHKDDIELISEMLQSWLFDVYCQTWIIKILLKNPWMADTRILFVMINLTQSLQWESSWIVSDKIAFHSLLISSAIFLFFLLCAERWSDWSYCVSATAQGCAECRFLPALSREVLLWNEQMFNIWNKMIHFKLINFHSLKVFLYNLLKQKASIDNSTAIKKLPNENTPVVILVQCFLISLYRTLLSHFLPFEENHRQIMHGCMWRPLVHPRLLKATVTHWNRMRKDRTGQDRLVLACLS